MNIIDERIFPFLMMILIAAYSCNSKSNNEFENLSDTHPGTQRGVLSITQFGITWYFDRELIPATDYGQFANGDYGVAGPVNVIGIEPSTAEKSGRIINGSMLYPPSAGSFRPGYCDPLQKLYNVSELDYSKLTRLSPPPSMPLMSDVERAFGTVIFPGSQISTGRQSIERHQLPLPGAVLCLLPVSWELLIYGITTPFLITRTVLFQLPVVIPTLSGILFPVNRQDIRYGVEVLLRTMTGILLWICGICIEAATDAIISDLR